MKNNNSIIKWAKSPSLTTLTAAVVILRRRSARNPSPTGRGKHGPGGCPVRTNTRNCQMQIDRIFFTVSTPGSLRGRCFKGPSRRPCPCAHTLAQTARVLVLHYRGKSTYNIFVELPPSSPYRLSLLFRTNFVSCLFYFYFFSAFPPPVSSVAWCKWKKNLALIKSLSAEWLMDVQSAFKM